MTVAIEQLYRLLRHFEKGPVDDPNCRLTEDGAALDAYQCSAGKWTIAFGCTKDLNGNPIKQGDSIRPDEVYAYTEAAVERVLEDVKRIVKRPLNAYQQAALCSFVFNLGGANLAKSRTYLPAIEAGRWEDAAEAGAEFVRAWGSLDGKHYRQALLGLRIRRYAEGLTMLGLDFEDACNADNIGMPKRREWQPDWVDPDGVRTGGRYFDVLLPGATEFTTIEAMARSTPLPPLELILTNKAEPRPSSPAASVGQPAVIAPSLPQAAPAPVTKPAETVPSGPAVRVGPAPVPAPPATKPAPVPVPRPPDPPIPIGQQASAVDATRKAEEWSSSPKHMLLSRRFWGLFLIVVGRLWLLKTGSNAVLGAVSDPLIMEMFGGLMVMIIGESVQWWGRAKARRPLC